jgi:cardiolipin synthase
MDALKISAMGGVKIKLLVPGNSDLRLTNAAAWSYYGELLTAGVEIYTYNRGFIHAKTMVIDNHISVVGTANMDHRSFDLNFEVNAIIYDFEFAEKLKKSFNADLVYSEKIRYEEWETRSLYIKLGERMARLFSPLI